MESLSAMNSYVKSYVKTEVLMGYNGNARKRGLECPNHKCGHLDKDSVWTLV